MASLLARHAVAASAAALLFSGCGGSQTVPNAVAPQSADLRSAAKLAIKWVPGNVILTPKGKTKLATLEFLTRYGGVAYQINCVGHFSIGRSHKSVKHGVTYLSYPLTAKERGPYHCTWEAMVNIGHGQKAASTLFIIVKRR
jgi:hypothetical protein